jgi:hypothetical protein
MRADLPWLEHLSRFDRFFPSERPARVFRIIWGSLGIEVEKQPRLRLEEAPILHPLAAAIRVPEEVHLVARSLDGNFAYCELLGAAAIAQSYAWTSSNLYPEFRRPGDEALDVGWSGLFAGLSIDQTWLASMLGFTESREYRGARAVCELGRARREAARLIYRTERDRETGANDARYIELLTDASRVGYDATGHLDVGGADPFDEWRGRAFEAQLREHLKSKYGARWWESRRAGEMLIDLWNTGHRYTADELSAQIGLGALSFDHLAADLTLAILTP